MKTLNQILLITLFLFTMPSYSQTGLVTIKSQHSVEVTADRFENLVKDKGLKFFTRINHAQNAANNDLNLRPTEVILFGNPLAGTPLMNCAQTVAIDLPQKALFWQDENDDVWVSYNDPAYLKERHNIQGCDPVLEKITGLLANLANGAAQ